VRKVTLEIVLEDMLAAELEDFSSEEPKVLHQLIELALTRRHIQRQIRERDELHVQEPLFLGARPRPN